MADPKFPANIEELYLLGRLDARQKADYEAFLKENADARAALEQEKILISGIRRAGKNALKREIREQVRGRKAGGYDASMFWKAAAVFLVAILVPSLVFFSHQMEKSSAPVMISSDNSAADEFAARMEMPEEETDLNKPVVSEKPVSADRESTENRRSRQDMAGAVASRPAKEKKQAIAGQSRRTNEQLAAGSSEGSRSQAREKSLEREFQPSAPVNTGAEFADEFLTEAEEEADSRLPYQAVELRNLHKSDKDAMALDDIAEPSDELAQDIGSNKQTDVFYYTAEDRSMNPSSSSGGVSGRSMRQFKMESNVVQDFRSANIEKTWLFRSDSKNIEVNLIATGKKKNQLSFPEEFSVSISQSDSLNNLFMDWEAPTSFADLNPSTIIIRWQQDNSLSVTIADSIRYRISLSASSTTAQKQ